MHIVFVLHDSESIVSANFTLAKTFLLQPVARLNIGNNRWQQKRVGGLHKPFFFGHLRHNGKLRFPFNGHRVEY